MSLWLGILGSSFIPEEAKEAAKASALAKLTALGLIEEEALATIGG